MMFDVDKLRDNLAQQDYFYYESEINLIRKSKMKPHDIR